ncbi:MAG: hypothetical protein ABI334_06710 [Candidatus Dormiibacterota bacterium]
MLRVVGIVALIVLATACDQTTAKTVASPSPVIAQGNWIQNLTLTGEVSGQMTGIVPDTVLQQSECTGSKSHTGEKWSDSFYGTIDASGDQWGVVFLIANFRGPGTYVNADVDIQLHNSDLSKVWENHDPDKVTFFVDSGQQSGTVDAALTSADSGKSSVQHVTGRWNCRG